MSFESDKPFNDFVHFPRGIRRSGLFSIKESELLEERGDAMTELYRGAREPADEAERTFLAQLASEEAPTDLNAKVFRKYLAEISPKKSHNLTTSTDDDGYDAAEEPVE